MLVGLGGVAPSCTDKQVTIKNEWSYFIMYCFAAQQLTGTFGADCNIASSSSTYVLTNLPHVCITSISTIIHTEGLILIV